MTGFRPTVKEEQRKKSAKKSSRKLVDPISIEAKHLALYFTSRAWPANSRPNLESVIQRSLTNYADLLKHVYDHWLLQPTMNPEGGMNLYREFMRTFWAMFLKSPEAFVKDWIEEVRTYIMSLKHFKGDLSKFIFTFEQKSFQNQCLKWTFDYCGYDDHWKRFCKEYKAAKWGKR